MKMLCLAILWALVTKKGVDIALTTQAYHCAWFAIATERGDDVSRIIPGDILWRFILFSCASEAGGMSKGVDLYLFVETVTF